MYPLNSQRSWLRSWVLWRSIHEIDKTISLNEPFTTPFLHPCLSTIVTALFTLNKLKNFQYLLQSYFITRITISDLRSHYHLSILTWFYHGSNLECHKPIVIYDDFYKKPPDIKFMLHFLKSYVFFKFMFRKIPYLLKIHKTFTWPK